MVHKHVLLARPERLHHSVDPVKVIVWFLRFDDSWKFLL